MKSYVFVLMILLVIPGCRSSNPNSVLLSGPEVNTTVIGDYELLFIGNSHSSKNGLPDLVATLIKTGQTGKVVNAALAPGWGFLDDRLKGNDTQEMLVSRAWTHVILQAQKYSSTGQYWYSTDAAEEWIRRVKTQNAIPIMFPEWRRRGNTEEGLRIHNLHLYIAAKEPACVAPIGLAWEESIQRYPFLILHHADGNHSNLKGALLSAYVFYEVITKQSAMDLPYVESIDVSAEIQQQLRDVASFVMQNNLACPVGIG